MNKDRVGFTLIELLAVIAMIAVISTLGVAFLSEARRQARDTKRLADISQIQKALALYQTDYGVYPDSCNWVTASTCAALAPYLPSIASINDPQAPLAARCNEDAPPCNYDLLVVHPTTYRIRFYLEKKRNTSDPWFCYEATQDGNLESYDCADE